MPRPILLILSALLLTGCAAGPPVQGYPRLVPMETLLIEAPAETAPQAGLAARAAALTARAEALRQAEP